MTNPIFLPSEPPVVQSRKLLFASLVVAALAFIAMFVLTRLSDEATVSSAGFALIPVALIAGLGIASSFRSLDGRVRRSLDIKYAMRASVDNHYALVLDSTVLEDVPPANRSTPAPTTFRLPGGGMSRHMLSFEQGTGRPAITDMLESLVPADSLKRDRPLNDESGR